VVNVAYQQIRKFGHIHRTQIGIGMADDFARARRGP